MTKRQLIDQIQQFNPNVKPQFLMQFDDEALDQYLQHLKAAQERTVKIASWVRRRPAQRMAS